MRSGSVSRAVCVAHWAQTWWAANHTAAAAANLAERKHDLAASVISRILQRGDREGWATARLRRPFVLRARSVSLPRCAAGSDRCTARPEKGLRVDVVRELGG